VIARLFLADNGYTVSFDRAEMVRTMVSLMAGTIDETAMTEWLRVRIRAI
jgi:death-on-curing protein